MSERILIVDDDPDIRDVVSLALESEQFDVVEAADGESALNSIESAPPDLIVLDIVLPDIEGRELFRRIQAERDIPTIFLSRKSGDIDRILGLELGADGYMTKPFNARELAARVKAVLRRIRKATGERAAVGSGPSAAAEAGGSEETRRFGPLTVDPVERRVFWEEAEVELTKIQFDLLAAMMNYPKKVYERGELIRKAYGPDTYVSERTVDSHIRRIRNAFQEAAGVQPIETVRGVGFKLQVS